MAKNYNLVAEKRDRAGKGIARELRRNNKIPAVIYGDGKEPVKITLDQNEVNVTYYKGGMFTTVCDMDVAGDKYVVLARDIQLHPVTDVVEHADFLRVTNKTRIAVDVPVEFINEDQSPGMQEKGSLNVVRFKVELMCAAMSIPDHIEVDLAGKEHNDAIKISDAKLPEGVTPVIDDRDFTIAVLMPPKTAEQLEEELEHDDDDGIEREAEEGDAAEGGEEAAEGDAEKADE